MSNLLETAQLATITAPHAAPWTLRTEHEVVGSEEQRQELLNKLRAGESFELYLDMVAYSQAPGVRNRKFVRFARLDAMAATGKGTVFLKDHNQGRMAAVGGTIIESRLQLNGLATEIHQTALLVKKWALRAALLGLMRGFSIGWNLIATPGKLEPEIHCTLCQAPAQNCGHWRGTVTAGQVVEWEIQNAELLETSAVPIPAVRETRPLEVREQRSALAFAAELSNFGVTVDVPCALINEDTHDMKDIALALGLAADATEDAILGALKGRDGQAVKLAGELDAAKAEAKLALERELKTAGELEAIKALATKTSAALADEQARAFADDLVRAGKLTGPEGRLYAIIVEEHKKDSAAAEQLGASLAVITAVGRELQTDRKPDTATAAATSADGKPDFAALATKLNAHDQALVRQSKRPGAEFVQANYAELAREYGWPEKSN